MIHWDIKLLAHPAEVVGLWDVQFWEEHLSSMSLVFRAMLFRATSHDADCTQ